jgi:hypothetical protein
LPTDEYPELFWHPIADMDALLKKKRFVPLSMAIFRKAVKEL